MALHSCCCLVFVALMMTVQLHSVLGNTPVCSKDYSLCGDYCYKTSPIAGNAQQALSYCTRVNGIAAEPKSQEEHNNIKSLLNETTWIGIADLDNNGTYEYASDNKSVGFTSIDDSIDSRRSGKCVVMDSMQGYNWTLAECSSRHPVVCQKVPTGNVTSTAVLPSCDLTTEAQTQGPNKNTAGSTTAGSKGSGKGSQRSLIVAVAASLGTVLGVLLLLTVLLYFFCRRRARNQEDNMIMTSKPNKDTDKVGMGELGTAQDKDGENTYQTIQDSAVNSMELPAVPTTPPSEGNENYSTIPDLKSLPTEDRVDERAPAPPPNQTEQGITDYYSVVRDGVTTSFVEDQVGRLDTAKTSQEPEYAVVPENITEESDAPEYAVVNKIRKKDQKVYVEGKEEDQYGMVDNVTYEPF